MEGDRLVLTVTDHGPGIPAGELESVFGRFAKAGGGEGGSGLGLAIAREHASALGGEVRAESEPGAGAAFSLIVPVAEPLPAGDDPVASHGEDGDMSTRELSS